MLTALYLALAAALLGGLGFAGLYLSRRAADSKLWTALSRAWVVLQAVVAHVEAKIRPDVVSRLADGVLTREERLELQAKALALAKEALADQLPEIARLFKLGTPSALDVFLSGLLERAYLAMKGVPTSALGLPVFTGPAPAAPSVVVPRPQ